MSRRSCRFYNKPGGCRNPGCTYAHVDPAGSNPPSPARNSETQPGVASPQAGSATPGSVPKGVCRYYWETGECNRGFTCRARHEQPAAASTSAGASGRSSSGTMIPAALAPFLTNAALARLSEPGTDALFPTSSKPRSPSEVHNLLARFLYDNYHFRHAFDIYAFTSLLSDATSNNTTWVSTSLLLGHHCLM